MLIRWTQLTEQKPGWIAFTKTGSTASSNNINRLFLGTMRWTSQKFNQKLDAQSAAHNLIRLNKKIIGAKIRLSHFQTWLEKHITDRLYCSIRTANLSSKISTVLVTHPRNPKLCRFCLPAMSADWFVSSFRPDLSIQQGENWCHSNQNTFYRWSQSSERKVDLSRVNQSKLKRFWRTGWSNFWIEMSCRSSLKIVSLASLSPCPTMSKLQRLQCNKILGGRWITVRLLDLGQSVRRSLWTISFKELTHSKSKASIHSARKR